MYASRVKGVGRQETVAGIVVRSVFWPTLVCRFMPVDFGAMVSIPLAGAATSITTREPIASCANGMIAACRRSIETLRGPAEATAAPHAGDQVRSSPKNASPVDTLTLMDIYSRQHNFLSTYDGWRRWPSSSVRRYKSSNAILVRIR